MAENYNKRELPNDKRYMYWAKQSDGLSALSNPSKRLSIPFPASGSKWNNQMLVDAARNAKGQVQGGRVGRDVISQDIKYNALQTSTMWEIGQFLRSNPFFLARVFDNMVGRWVNTYFYKGDISGEAWGINPENGEPVMYVDVSLSVIDMGYDL